MNRNLFKLITRHLLGLLLITYIFVSETPIVLAKDNNVLEQANEAFQQQNYQDALNKYRKYLRKNPKEYDIWNLLGASYYHNGQPRLGLVALKKGLKGTKLKSQNYFYQGNCYSAINQPKRAKQYLKKTAKGKDSFAALAMYELIGLEYDSRNYTAAKTWISAFQQTFQDHELSKEIATVAKRIAQGIYIPMEKTLRQQYLKGIFRNHNLSLTETPHFWFFQAGLDYAAGTRSNPAYQGEPIVETGAGFEESFLKLAAGFGLGPLQQEDSQVYLGYYYTQDWYTNTSRMEIYFEDPSDFTYFPYRPDLQEREHRLFVEMKSTISESIDIGLYGDIFFKRSGSKIYPAPERPEIRQSTNISQGNGLIPWISWKLNANHSFYGYLYFTKEINLEQNDDSKQSYAIFSSSSDPFFSFSTGYEGKILRQKLSLGAEIYQYRFLTNNFWEEYQRTGITLSSKYRFGQNWYINGRITSYTDDYIYDQIKSGTCDFSSTLSTEGVTCPRTDSGLNVLGGISYRPSAHHSFSGYFGLKKHTNPDLKVYDEERFEIYAFYTLAFPSVDVIGRYINGLHNSFNPKEVF